MPTVFLDCDGVLADIDADAERVFGMPPREFERRFGLRRFWGKLASLDDFFGELSLLRDATQKSADHPTQSAYGSSGQGSCLGVIKTTPRLARVAAT